MENLRKHVIALLAVSLTLGSCSQEEPSDEQKMRDFDFSNFEETTITVKIEDEHGNLLPQMPLLMLEDGLPKATGWSNENGEWITSIQTNAGAHLEVLINDPMHINGTDIGNLDNVTLRVKEANHFSALKTATDSTADNDGDGRPNYADVRPNDPNIVDISSTYEKLTYEDIYPHMGDYDFNDVAVDVDFHYLLDTNGYVRHVIIDVIPFHSGAAKSNSFNFNFSGINSNDISNIIDSSGTNHDVISTLNGSNIKFSVYDDFGAIGRYWVNPDGFVRTLGGINFTNTKAYPVAIRYQGTTIIADILHENLGNQWNLSSIKTFFDDVTTTISFDLGGQYLPADLANSFDPYIITEENREVHLKSFDSNYADDAGMPFGMSIPQTVYLPGEGVSIGTKYSKFTSWATSNGTMNQNWWE